MRCGTHIQWNTAQPLRKNEILQFGTPWMYLESITLSEINEMLQVKNHMIALIYRT